MITHYPKIVNDGLILCLDAGNLTSCGGQPVTNLLTYTNNFSSSWGGYCGPTSNVTFNTTDITDPLGTNTAVKFVRNTNVVCNSTQAWGLLYSPAVPIITSGKTYTTSFYARGAVGGETLDFGVNDSNFYFNQALTTKWTRYSATFTNVTDTSRGFQFRNTAGSCTFYIWGPQTVLGSAAGPYAESVGTTNGTANLVWKDLSSNNNNSTIQNNPIYSSTNNGFLSFDGATQKSVGSFLSFNVNSTWEAWINCEQSINEFNMFMGRYLPYFGFNTGNRIIFSNNIGGTQRTIRSTPTNLVTNKWYHIVGTTEYDGTNTTMRIYINASLSITETFAGAQDNSATDKFFTVGDWYQNSDGTYMFKGKIASVRIYNRTLSLTEISQNFNSQRGRFSV